MPLDAVCLQAVVEELLPELLNVRIDKVQQPVRDQVILQLRGNRRLLLNAGASAPRIQFTQIVRDNPMEPPMFCMLLRKHLVGGRIVEVCQPDMERLVELKIQVTDDFGQVGQRSLILEAMGRHSNLILLDGDRRIVDCLHRVDAEMSPQRQVLPGLFYELPPTQNKQCLPELSEEQLAACLTGENPEKRLDAYLLERFLGLSPLVAREIVFCATGETDTRLGDLSAEVSQRFTEELIRFAQLIREKKFTPVILRQQDGKVADFSYLPIRQYGAFMQMEQMPSFSQLLDVFYEAREQQERIRQRGQDLIRTATTARDRMRRKLAQQEKDYAATQNRDQLRIYGDLLTANLYRMRRGENSFTTENFYDENGGSVTIPLDPLLTPQQNAAKYYKRYTKAKTAEKYLREQMEIARREEAYLESVLEEIHLAETEQDFLDIRNELKDSGYLRSHGKEKREWKRVNRPREFRTSGGFRVLVGRNNRQNDQLTLKTAEHRDYWLHTQKIHGSHVILCTEGRTPAQEDLVEAAKIAAWYSQARGSSNIPVDYTLVKNVKKPSGARPGMVIYTTYQTVNVLPEEDTVKGLLCGSGK